MSYQAMIFDLDGTLLDSERVWFTTYLEACAKYGKEYTGEHHALMMGRSKEVNLQILEEQVGVRMTLEELNMIRAEAKRRLFERGALVTKVGVQSFLSALVDRGYRLGVATASGKEYREKALKMTGLLQYFEGCVSGEEVKNPKPAPDVFLAIADRMGVDPAKCLAFEDAPAGVESALAAGMQVVGVRDRLFLRELPGVEGLIDDFTEITATDVERMGV
jgi:HAD superfamily hydrolase (TIGR01509 family)